jgi:hypothetical protein
MFPTTSFQKDSIIVPVLSIVDIKGNGRLTKEIESHENSKVSYDNYRDRRRRGRPRHYLVVCLGNNLRRPSDDAGTDFPELGEGDILLDRGPIHDT